ncbi:hypothetical protein [Rhizobium sp. 007]|nr:hypothetical protein [Rhizobium sp. 007]QPB18737.1 hypothetical protein ISN39_13880 [Rhizobium sp. 007]
MRTHGGKGAETCQLQLTELRDYRDADNNSLTVGNDTRFTTSKADVQ